MASGMPAAVPEVPRPISPSVHRAVKLLGRIGAASRGILYALLGFITLLAAADLHPATGPKGSLAALLAYPMGRPLVLAMAAGFASFAAFNLLVGTLNPGYAEPGLRGAGQRIATLFVAGTYISLTVYAIRLALWTHVFRPTLRENIATMLTMPAGRLGLGSIACGTAIFGVFEVHRALSRHPDRRLFFSSRLLRGIARVGLAGRGLLFLGIAVLLANVAIANNARDAGGIGRVLMMLQTHRFGHPLLLVVGISLVAFGVIDVVAPEAPHSRGG